MRSPNELAYRSGPGATYSEANLETRRIADPLRDAFALTDLPRVAPWIWEEVQRLEPARVLAALSRLGGDPDQPQKMTSWVAALRTLGGLAAAARPLSDGKPKAWRVPFFYLTHPFPSTFCSHFPVDLSHDDFH